MPTQPITITGNIRFKLRFNTAHGATDLYWRVIIGAAHSGEEEQEYLVRTIRCKVETYSESSYDARAAAIKYHIAGACTRLSISAQGEAIFI
jgi:hypothetical protein